jgi:diguanylate cyclase
VQDQRRADRSDFFLYIDLDNFKAVNDTGGHAAGDIVLRQVADTLKSAVTAADIVARMGGDEFAIILKDRQPGDGELVAEQVRAAIGMLGLEQESVVCRIGASVGLTAIHIGETDIEAIIARADRASYQAKTAGGGRVIVTDAVRNERPGKIAQAS